MIGTAAVVVLSLVSGMVVSDGEGPSRPFKVAVHVAPAPYLAGQPIPVRVEVAGAIEPPSIEQPRIANAEILRLSDEGLVPGQEARGVARFVVVPLRSGPLVIPPFRARSGASASSSGPTRLTVSSVPAAGRPASFLGGIGDFTLLAKAEPTSLRAGQTLEVRLRIEGSAAWGSVRPPDTSPWAAKIPGLRVQPLAPEAPGASEPPVRTFRFRLRPTQAGRWTLPPLAVSAYDPRSRAYLTRYSQGVAIRVAEPPGLDPDGIADHSGDAGPGPSSVSRPTPLAIIASGGIGVIVMILVAAWIVYRRGAGRDDPRRFARGLAIDLDPGWDAPEAARRITDGLIEYLRRRVGRPPGALTPPEIEIALARLTNDPCLPGRARRLIEDCDRARFAASRQEGGSLVVEAKGLLEDLAKMGGERSSRKPREAAETAKP